MNDHLENLYTTHHSEGDRAGFSIYEKKRGQWMASKIGTGKTVLDLGCRDGNLTQYFLKGNKVTGYDIDKKLLNRAEKKGIKTKHVNLYDSWSEKKKFDVVVLGEVLEHLYHPEELVEKATKVLKRDGMILVSVPNAYIISGRIKFLVGREIPAHYDPTHINLFSQGKLKKMLRKYFSNVDVTGIAPPAYRWLKPFSVSLACDDLLAVGQGIIS